MKWNDIQQHMKLSKSENGFPVKPPFRNWLPAIIFGLVIVIGVVIGFFIRKSNLNRLVLPPSELREINTFLDTYPPTPVTETQGVLIEQTINSPVVFDAVDEESINNFLK